jgi:hypothetical protein
VTYQPSRSTETISPPAAQAEEAIHWGKVVAIGVGSLIAFAIAIWISWGYMRAREKLLQPRGPDPIPLDVGKIDIGIVEQVPFDITRSFAAYRKDRMDRLEHWGWIDRKQGLVHEPIAKAMDDVVSELSGRKK